MPFPPRLCLAFVLALLCLLPQAALAAGDGYRNQPFTCLSGNCVNGQGLAQWPDGARYEGGFVNGQRQGKGAMAWPGGDRYSGDWLDGMRQGHGTMTWAAGNRYIGQWAQGARNGKGAMIYPSGKRVDGMFEADRLVETLRVVEPKAPAVAEHTPKPAPQATPKGPESGQQPAPAQTTTVPATPTQTSTPTQPAPQAGGDDVPVLQPAPQGAATPKPTTPPASTQTPTPTTTPTTTPSSTPGSTPGSTPTGTPTPTSAPPSQPVNVPAGDKPPKAQAAALLVEVSFQGKVQFVNLYLGGSLAELRQKVQASQLPQGFTSREALQYQGPPAWVAQYSTYAEDPTQAFCYGAALGCTNRDQCEASARQAWTQAGCLGLNSSEGYSAFDNGYPQELHPDTFPQVRFFR